MVRVLAGAAGLYFAVLLLGLLAAPLLGLPARAAPDFPGNARYKLQPRYDMSGAEIFAQVPPERMKERVILTVANGVMRAITVKEQQLELEEIRQGRPITPKGHVIKLMSQYSSWQGQVTTEANGKAHAFDLNFAVRDGAINVVAPGKCENLPFHHWALTLLGVGPKHVVYCPATDTKVRASAIITFYAVDGWLITQMYTQLTCSLIHDALSEKLGTTVDGREHICFGFREDTLPALWQRNPISVRHHIFKSN